MSDVVVTQLIAASPATVYSFFTDIEHWTEWQGVGGELDPRPGGSLRVEMPGGQVASGSFVELVPHSRIVFTWGWEGDATPVAPGASIVVVELEPTGAGTLLRLTHSGLAPLHVAEHHRTGWERYLERLHIRAEGGEPGPDRMPS
ncbi:MAG: SRPBCC domain-containing protein [Gaiellaceae bacterium]